MRELRILRMPLALAGVALLVACSATVTPPAPTPTAPAPVTSSAPGAITLPPRPRSIPIDKVDPCSLLTPSQRAGLKLEGEPLSSSDDSELLGVTRNCTLLGFGKPNFAIGIALASQVGIERYASGQTTDAISPIDVSGFPAVLARPSKFTDFCTVALDIARGQLIDIQFRDGGGQPPIPMDDLCTGARQVASDVMQTLLNR